MNKILNRLSLQLWVGGSSSAAALAIMLSVLTGIAACNPTCPAGVCRVVVFSGHCAELADDTNNQGATSCTGVKEWEYNDALVDRLSRLSDDELVYMAITAQMNVPLRSRTDLAQRIDAHVLVSIHHDSIQQEDLDRMKDVPSEDPSWDAFTGFSLWLAESREGRDAEFLAQMIADEFLELGMLPNLYHAGSSPGEGRQPLDRERGIYERDFYIVRTADMPAVIVELGVIINPQEESRLADDAFRDQVTDALDRALHRFFDYKGSHVGRRPGYRPNSP